MPTSGSQLEQVRALIKAGKKKQAVSELARLIERDHDNPELWWLLANASDDLHQARKALDEMQMLAPKDTRAEKLLRRLDTRIKLDQMGLQPKRQTNSNRQIITVAALAVILLIVLGVGAVALSGGFTPREDIVLPTEVVFANTATPENATATHTASPTLLPSETPTTLQATSQVQGVEPTQPVIVAEVTRELSVAEITPELSIAEVTVDVQPPTNSVSVPLATQVLTFPTPALPNAPTNNPLANPTRFIPPTNAALATGSAQSINPPAAALIQSESTSEIDPNFYSNLLGTPSFVAVTPSPTMIPTIAPLERGQIVENIPRRDLIEPYGIHAFTFSGYRDEKIKLELRNLSGEGNPSLELKDPTGTVIASDIDTQSGQNLDAVIELSLPGDGIYTVIVRMAAVEEQLYYLALVRG